MNLRLITIILSLTVSCKTQTSGWQTLDFGVFKLKTPQGWKKFDENGVDSYVGGLTNGKDSLWFDYGWYSPDIGEEDPKMHKFGQDTINGLKARLAIPIEPGKGYIRMFIPVNSQDKFSISGHGILQTDTILKIYRSIVFKESDTSINNNLAVDSFKIFPNGNGRTLFLANCASCHSVTKTLTGPALTDRIIVRSNEWIFKFLTNRQTLGKDTANLSLNKQFGMDCMHFPNLSKDNVDLIVDYIKNK
ncbi:c-type cytochrome [Flavisolibacter nicotianae]|uniref:c-type cytochrome n=1 Tax=Flavisolibacter nicotianae TaxID=2364882 RepID=UPI000EB334EF|nr:cytochrome c [Flavisolibacter nicotianae]